MHNAAILKTFSEIFQNLKANYAQSETFYICLHFGDLHFSSPVDFSFAHLES